MTPLEAVEMDTFIGDAPSVGDGPTGDVSLHLTRNPLLSRSRKNADRRRALELIPMVQCDGRVTTTYLNHIKLDRDDQRKSHPLRLDL
jgi:hypothetical protein